MAPPVRKTGAKSSQPLKSSAKSAKASPANALKLEHDSMLRKLGIQPGSNPAPPATLRRLAKHAATIRKPMAAAKRDNPRGEKGTDMTHHDEGGYHNDNHFTHTKEQEEAERREAAMTDPNFSFIPAVIKTATNAAVAGATTMKTHSRAGANLGDGNVVTSVPSAFSNIVNSIDAKTTPIRGGINIKHREYITEFAGSAAYTATTISVNAKKAMFKFLSEMAQDYEFYKFKKLAFFLYGSQGTTSQGRNILSFDYDVTDAPPTDKSDQYNTNPNASANAWSPIVTLDVPCNAWQQDMYLNRPSGSWEVSDADPLLYDCGRLEFGTYGTLATDRFELHVEYDVDLIKQHISFTGINLRVSPVTASTVISGRSVLGDLVDGARVSGSAPLVFNQVTASTNVFTWRGPSTVIEITCQLTATTIGGNPTFTVLTDTGAGVAALATAGVSNATTDAQVTNVYRLGPGYTVAIAPNAGIAGCSTSLVSLSEVNYTSYTMAQLQASGQNTAIPAGFSVNDW